MIAAKDIRFIGNDLQTHYAIMVDDAFVGTVHFGADNYRVELAESSTCHGWRDFCCHDGVVDFDELRATIAALHVRASKP